jgi:transposase
MPPVLDQLALQYEQLPRGGSRVGCPWRDLPAQLGAWQSVWERHRRWSEDGTYAAMFTAVREYAAIQDATAAGLLAIDSTSVRAHQHRRGGPFHQSSTPTRHRQAGMARRRRSGRPAVGRRRTRCAVRSQVAERALWRVPFAHYTSTPFHGSIWRAIAP